jgi:hypothetical protein
MRRKRKTKRESAAATDHAAEQDTAAEDTAIREVIVRSLNNLIPADNALPMDAALAWTRQEWGREEAKQHRRLLEEAAAWCHAAPRRTRTAHRTRG